MSDYLGNLATRSVKADQVIHPRPLSLFEPVLSAAVHPSSVGFRYDLETGQEAPAVNETNADRESAAQQPGQSHKPNDAPLPLGQQLTLPVVPQTEEKPISPATPQQTAKTEPRITPALDRSVAPAQPVTESVDRPVIVEQRVAPPEARPTRSRDKVTAATLPTEHQPLRPKSLLEPVSREIVIERVTSPSDSWPSAGNVEKKLHPILDNSSPLRPQPVSEPAVPPITIEETRLPAKTEPAIPFQPQIKSYVEPARPASTPSKAIPEVAPTIQVTIGRIEVRATPPPEPVAKKRPSAPAVMSLDEYLRRRNRGGKQ